MISQEASSTFKRFDGLDTLRAVAILLVFAYHYMVFVSGTPTFGWVSTVGWTGVDLFFVLSGYLIGNQLFAGIAKGKALSLRAFYIRRILRTLPNYYVVLALYFMLPTVMGGKQPPPLWRFLTFTQNLWLKPGTAFSHAWSLCIEEQFYLLLPLVIVGALHFGRSMSKRAAWFALTGLILAGVALRCVLWFQYGQEAGGAVEGYYPNIYYSSFCRFDEFLPGVAIALLKNFHPRLWERVVGWGRTTLAAGVLATAVLFYLLANYYYIDGYGYGFAMTGFGYSLMACAFALLVVAALSPGSLLYRVRVPGAASLAAWSYAIYLSHKPLAHIMRTQLEPWGLGEGTRVAIISAVCLLGGWLLYRFVETPFMRLRDRHHPTNFHTADGARTRQAGGSLAGEPSR
ncbi:acyltransferase [Vitiosangium sp. GDMCC 1.1324]|uniref:acyltransferase family protein n=1 Tax=Vitiosangium sp. (strain GDMCC 1.1324) TaxID=2138576 RepID=UPI000D38FA84|nr:acyltransferase [Vitiosangium sp. GDMCC 1.1324]PTL78893.1 acyltransferase [Vitiosangium sp. GDMCC 1.1324]